ncbi:MAG: hypothetical protein A2W33_09065 [Chloroflexi bacterium RBG_16_52_11]|nr:MAG: hypothetical protein A2W33_09065 [Chloroflexi bacterium RBG_16_52_11]
MRIGVLELQSYPANHAWDYIEHFFSNKQYASITPQAISFWCRQMGHQVYYVTYPGFGDPISNMPDDLDIVFIATHTLTAPLAYALCKVYRGEGTRTVLGGPHAKSFPQDCVRYSDLVVLECDQALVEDIIHDRYPPGSIISSPAPYQEVPLIEERLPEIKIASFVAGRPHPGSFIPLLSSMGCPYTCNFCSDWNNPYLPLSNERLLEDLHFASETYPGVKLVFHDPNFAVRFEEVMAVLERIPPNKQSPYGVQSTFTILRTDRLERLRDTHCIFILPSIESWTTMYSNKLGVGKIEAGEKLAQMVEKFRTLREYIPYLGTNLIFGLDHDSGPEPFELTKEFLLRAPFVYPTLHIPIPFGGTPMFDTLLKEGRILKTMPFTFYRVPHMTILFKNYDPIEYMEYMVDLFATASSQTLLKMRFASDNNFIARGINLMRTITAKRRYKVFGNTLELLKNDPQFLAFHKGETEKLPDHYVLEYKRIMGKYSELVPVGENSWHDFERSEATVGVQPQVINVPKSSDRLFNTMSST